MPLFGRKPAATISAKASAIRRPGYTREFTTGLASCAHSGASGDGTGSLTRYGKVAPASQLQIGNTLKLVTTINWKSFGLVSVVAAATVVSCSGPSPGLRSTLVSQPGDVRQVAPDFTLKDASGAAVKLSDLRGKVVLLNFWATWCGPCAVEIPWFIEFEQQYKSRGLEVVGVSMDNEGWAAIKPFVASHKMNYRVLLGNDTVGQLYGGVEALPTTFIIDRDGRFAGAPYVGLAGKNDYLDEIQKLLGVKQTNASLSRSHVLPAFFFVGPTE